MNIPDEACLQTSEAIQKLVTQLTADDILITLTSGEYPVLESGNKLIGIECIS